MGFNHKRGNGFSILIGGLIILFYLYHSFNNEELVKYSLTTDHTMTIIEIPEDEALEWISAFINTGGSFANMGTNALVLKVKPGLNKKLALPPIEERGVLFEMAARHIPCIHLRIV